MWVYYVFFWQRISCVFNAPFLRAQWTCSCYPTTKNYVISSAVFCFCLFSTKIPLISPSVLSF